MPEKLFTLFGWTNAQIRCFALWQDSCRTLFGKRLPLKQTIALLLATVELFGAAVFKAPIHPRGDAPDLSGYELVFCDEFDGDALNEDVWYYRGVGGNRSGYRAESQIKVENGNLVLTGEYRDAENGRFGAGWYAGAIALREWYCKGYFEVRCICNKGEGFWSAFWMQSNHSYDSESLGGVGGAEIDIMEATDWDAILPANRDVVTQTVYCNGSDDNDEEIDKCQFSAYGSNIFEEYNTYSVLWTDDEYVFYVNGRETYRTSFGLGVSQALENVIVSLELPEEMPKKIDADHAHKTQMIVDYVKIYQIAE